MLGNMTKGIFLLAERGLVLTPKPRDIPKENSLIAVHCSLLAEQGSVAARGGIKDRHKVTGSNNVKAHLFSDKATTWLESLISIDKLKY